MGYNHKYIENLKIKVINSILTPRRNPNNDKLTIYWKLPFIAKFEGLNKKVVNNINSVIEPTTSLKIAYKTLKSSTFFPNKDKISFGLHSNVVYRYECDQCSGCTYIGETKRHLSTRMKEHIKGRPVPSEISLHHHVAKEGNFSIVLKTAHPFIGEALIYQGTPESRRINNNLPPFQLKLFNFPTAEAV